MKPLFKYSSTLFTLLLLAYTQVFAHVNRNDFAELSHIKKSHQLQVPVTHSVEIDGDYYEEENKRNLFRTFWGNPAGFGCLHDLSDDNFFRHVKGSFSQAFVSHPFNHGASRFRILRL